MLFFKSAFISKYTENINSRFKASKRDLYFDGSPEIASYISVMKFMHTARTNTKDGECDVLDYSVYYPRLYGRVTIASP